MKNKISFLAIFLIILAYVIFIGKIGIHKEPKTVISYDIISYYAYLPATFIEKDYKLRNWEHEEPWKSRYWPAYVPKTGSYVIKTSMGLTFLYYPFFQVAHILAPHLGYENNGFTAPYSTALILSSLFYLTLGMFLLRKILLQNFSDIITAATLLTIGIGTNLFWYATKEAPMSHSYSFMLLALFMFLTEKWHEKPNLKNSIFMGLNVGLISLVRPTNVLVVLYFLLYNILSFEDLKNRVLFFLSKYKAILIMLVCAFVVWIPQFLYWKSVTGQFLYFSYGSDENFFFGSPKIMKVLFGFRKGWFIYTPSMIFSVIGIFMLRKTKYFWGILSFILINIYVVSSWWCWWYGGGFGMRALIETYALLAIPLATYFAWLASQKIFPKIALGIITIAIILQSYFHNLQYQKGTIHWDAMTKEAYFDSFWRLNASENFYDYLEDPNYKDAKQNIR